MNDTNVPSTQEGSGRAFWLMLIPQLPPKPDYLRVKLRRRLQRVGAIALRNAVYVLPYRDDTTEDFMWLRSELKDDGADAIICAAATIAGASDTEIIELFNEARDSDYRAIIDEARELLKAASGDDASREVAKLNRRLDELGKVDFFGAEQGAAAREAVERLTRPVEPSRAVTPQRNEYRGRMWVTRSGVFVDRIASAWLIRRFIDPSATFKFVSAANYSPHPDELRFDMYDAEFTHEGDRCTFETLLRRFDLNDAALNAIAEIVHDIDLKDGKFERLEASGVESVLAGIAGAYDSDADRVANGSAIFDALYAQLSVKPKQE
jgi:hypothetical protein